MHVCENEPAVCIGSRARGQVKLFTGATCSIHTLCPAFVLPYCAPAMENHSATSRQDNCGLDTSQSGAQVEPLACPETDPTHVSRD